MYMCRLTVGFGHVRHAHLQYKVSVLHSCLLLSTRLLTQLCGALPSLKVNIPLFLQQIVGQRISLWPTSTTQFI